LGCRKFSVKSFAADFAISMVWFSSDSRTPLRRPSMAGRIPIFDNLPRNLLHGSFIVIPLIFAMTGPH
jgi:hypothetical protein